MMETAEPKRKEWRTLKKNRSRDVLHHIFVLFLNFCHLIKYDGNMSQILANIFLRTGLEHQIRIK